MPENNEVKNNKNKKLSEQEMQDWLDNVHFGSCCSDPLDQPSTKQERCSTSNKENKAAK
ncbi:hypothetical protein [Psychromonas aquatilis]|uniref:Uncharacterized protein n=1 Tax=Psychromonas aquatilis TaxID=2005072 RepID=A0ABU9GPD3_9GAMM